MIRKNLTGCHHKAKRARACYSVGVDIGIQRDVRSAVVYRNVRHGCRLCFPTSMHFQVAWPNFARRVRLTFSLAVGGGIQLSIIIVFVIVIIIDQLLKVHLVSKNASDTAKALDELITFCRSVRHKLEACAKVLVVLGNPF